MEKIFNRFVSDDAGAVETDWLTLIAGALMLAGAVFGTVAGGGDQFAQGEVPQAHQASLL